MTRNCLRDIAEQFQNWVKNRCQKWGVPILDAPDERRDDFVAPYFKHAKNDAVVVILKAREPARIMIAIGAENRWHLQLAQRWIVQYNFYINDRNWGRMFVRICPYLPFSARVCLNQHHWLANRMRSVDIDFKAMCQCIPQMQSSTAAPGISGFLDRSRSATVRTKMVSLSDSIL